ncbi:Hypothetical protein R9X50_00658400 [Acrodontium crateriforme]|uniref:Serine-threonine protein kinase 19 n=1 Tax=Acrodontium crateriforme TaxID=150365 RepID=A0AAQ3MBV3_9PEZI|nr:Hypothetical protein R9X50_00658400 [Acrodontium crateriforme]
MPKAAKFPFPIRKTASSRSVEARKSQPLFSKPAIHSDRLPDPGLTPPVLDPDAPQHLPSLIKYILQNTFDDVPDRSAGMGSERISEILRFRDGLPPIVSLAHVFALSQSATQTEREMARLVAAGTVRKIVIPGRGKSGGLVGEGLVLVDDWIARVKGAAGLTHETGEKYIALLHAKRGEFSTTTSSFTTDEVRELVTHGFLTSPTSLSSSSQPSSLLAPKSAASSLATAGSTFTTGTLAAIGGSNAITASGGSGSTLLASARPSNNISYNTMTFSLPNTGAYLKLQTTARAHLHFLLRQISPAHREASNDLLREKWNGNTIAPGDAAANAKKARGESSAVLPGRTKRWREFWGTRYEWVLAEAVGSGGVECFDTGAVGLGVRAR